MAVNCDPAALVEAAKCYKCIPTGTQSEVMIMLLNVISGLNLTPQQLMERASCYKCIPTGMQPEVHTMLLCEIATASGA